MITLFLDTSLADVSIAVLKDGKILSNIHENIPGKHSMYVSKYIEDILKNNKIAPKEVDKIIVVNGPGSFTGIRIGVAIAKMYSYLAKNNIVTITSLKAKTVGETSDYILSKIDAKHDNYYVGLYDREYNTIKEEFMNIDSLNEVISKYNPLVVEESKEYNVEAIYEYTKDFEGMNPHSVNPIYLKLPEAMEKK